MKFIVTVKLNKNPCASMLKDLRPIGKISGRCPVILNTLCTDIIGEHHSYLAEAKDIHEMKKKAESDWTHVTRIEQVG